MPQLPDLKGSSFTLSVLHLSDGHVPNIVAFLAEKIAQAPAFFASAPVVINISKVKEEIDFVHLKQAIHDVGMIPVGIAGCKNKNIQDGATQAGFAIMSASKSVVAPAKMAPPQVYRSPIRSGQQVYAKNADLIILSHVGAGAEVIADGNIHIHGALRGRAIAGANGQMDAKIICCDLQAELVSIAGNYWVSDQIASKFWQQKIMLSLHENSLQLELINI